DCLAGRHAHRAGGHADRAAGGVVADRGRPGDVGRVPIVVAAGKIVVDDTVGQRRDPGRLDGLAGGEGDAVDAGQRLGAGDDDIGHGGGGDADGKRAGGGDGTDLHAARGGDIEVARQPQHGRGAGIGGITYEGRRAAFVDG